MTKMAGYIKRLIAEKKLDCKKILGRPTVSRWIKRACAGERAVKTIQRTFRAKKKKVEVIPDEPPSPSPETKSKALKTIRKLVRGKNTLKEEITKRIKKKQEVERKKKEKEETTRGGLTPRSRRRFEELGREIRRQEEIEESKRREEERSYREVPTISITIPISQKDYNRGFVLIKFPKKELTTQSSKDYKQKTTENLGILVILKSEEEEMTGKTKKGKSVWETVKGGARTNLIAKIATPPPKFGANNNFQFTPVRVSVELEKKLIEDGVWTEDRKRMPIPVKYWKGGDMARIPLMDDRELELRLKENDIYLVKLNREGKITSGVTLGQVEIVKSRKISSDEEEEKGTNSKFSFKPGKLKLVFRTEDNKIDIGSIRGRGISNFEED